MNPWLNFRQIKQAIPIGKVLEHYGWKCVRHRGDRVEGRCPIHRGQREDTFHADLRQNGFHCFSCQAHGNVLDLVAALERCSLRQAALWLAERFGVEGWVRLLEQGVCVERKPELIREKERASTPLRFSLRPVDSGHAYLKQRGIGVDTATHFGVGYYGGPGLMHGQVVIPIHDERGQLLAYAGRSIDGACPKYRLPAGFRKSAVLFNLHRAAAHGPDRLIVVEGFFDCLKVHQAGHPCVVALMGCSFSSEQERLLIARFSKIVLMLDGDPAGQHASVAIANRLISRCTIDMVQLGAGHQPDELSSENIHRVLSTAVRRVQRHSKVMAYKQ